MALAVMADATKVTAGRIGKEDVSAKIDSLSVPLKAPTSTRARSDKSIAPSIVNEDIDVFGDCFLIRASAEWLVRKKQRRRIMPEFKAFRAQVDAGALTVTLDDPPLNLIGPTLAEELIVLIQEAAASPAYSARWRSPICKLPCSEISLNAKLI
jgi:hypothetical protein